MYNFINMREKEEVKAKKETNTNRETFKEGFVSVRNHARYSLKKTMTLKNRLWIVTAILSFMFFFTWREEPIFNLPEGSLVSEGAYLTSMIFGIIILTILPIVVAFIVSKVYSDEKDRGDVVFVITKSDDRSMVFLGKYIATIITSVAWVGFFALSGYGWILFKHLIGLSLQSSGTLGLNPEAINLGYILAIFISITLMSIIFSMLWSGLYFLFAAFIPSRGVLFTSVLAPVFAICLPLIAAGMTGFDTTVSQMRTGEYEVLEYEGTVSQWGEEDVSQNAYFCTLELTTSWPSGWSNDYSWFYDVMSSELTIDRFDTNPNLDNPPNYLQQLSVSTVTLDQVKNHCESGQWLDQNNVSTISNIELSEKDNKAFPWTEPSSTKNYKKGHIYDYDIINQEWREETVSIDAVEKNNSVGWLSFLNPFYYFSTMIEKTFTIMVPDTQFKEDALSAMSFVSNWFGGMNKANLNLIDEASYDHLKNKEIFGIKNTNKNSANANNSRYNTYGYSGGWGDPVEIFQHTSYVQLDDGNLGLGNSGTLTPWTTEGTINVETFKIPYMKTVEAGLYEYTGIEYWIPPVGSAFLLITIGAGMGVLASYFISKQELSRL